MVHCPDAHFIKWKRIGLQNCYNYILSPCVCAICDDIYVKVKLFVHFMGVDPHFRTQSLLS